jgi:hypothetical protein
MPQNRLAFIFPRAGDAKRGNRRAGIAPKFQNTFDHPTRHEIDARVTHHVHNHR